MYFMRFIAIIKDLITLRFMSIFARISAILWVIFHFNLIGKKRRKMQKLRKADDKFLFKVFSEKYLFKKKTLI
jgi:uncharacterized membrane protein